MDMQENIEQSRRVFDQILHDSAYSQLLADADHLAGLIGLMCGFPNILIASVIGIVAAGVAAMILISRNSKSAQIFIPLAPFLGTATIITLIWGGRIAEFLTP